MQTATPKLSEPEIQAWPRLTRFYGLSFFDLVRMPRWAIRLYVEELPILEAEEQLTALQVSDHPQMESGDRKRIHRRLTRILERGAEPPPAAAPAAPNPERDQRKLRGMGIAVVMEPKKEKPEEVS